MTCNITHDYTHKLVLRNYLHVPIYVTVETTGPTEKRTMLYKDAIKSQSEKHIPFPHWIGTFQVTAAEIFPNGTRGTLYVFPPEPILWGTQFFSIGRIE